MSARRQTQTSIYETTLEDPELEAALKNRHAMGERRSTANHNFHVADERARKLIAAKDLGDGVTVRVGDFLVTQKPVAARDVSFKTEPTTRVTIKPVKE